MANALGLRACSLGITLERSVEKSTNGSTNGSTLAVMAVRLKVVMAVRWRRIGGVMAESRGGIGP